jgi:hypothetical protein
MSKNKNRQNRNNHSYSPTPRPVSVQMTNGNSILKLEATPSSEIEKLTAAAAAEMIEADLQAVEGLLPPAPNTSLEDLIAKANDAYNLLEAQRQRARREEEQAKKEHEALKVDRSKIDAEHDSIHKLRIEVDEKTKKLQTTEKELLKREEDLVKREIDADAGFMQRNKKALEAIEEEAMSIRENFSNHRSRIASENEAWDNELRDRRTALQEELNCKRSEFETTLQEKLEELQTREAEIQSEYTRLRKDARSLEVKRELLTEDRQAFKDRVEKHAAAKLEQRDSQITALEERLAIARKERDELARQIAEREDAERQFGSQTPVEVLHDMQELRRERNELKQAIGERPSAEAALRLEELERQREKWECDRLQLISEVSELKQDVIHKRIAVTELEALRNHKAALEAGNELLTKALEEEIRKINELVRGTDGASPFPSCARMDTDTTLQSTRPTTDDIPSLKKFTDYVRNRMAFDPNTEKKLYYSLEDVRSFIAGLSMSRLHLLQGISGTGKTSLPLAFARAIGADSALIEVQAGWRDRQDLIGHFNTFESRFYESEFLKSLYRASCPHFRDTPFIIVLDEMNLSHPEQYFADLLSALEQDQDRQRLVLMTAAVEPAPTLLVDAGSKLPIPNNVWFIGTANHDETTKDFAEKTYDRAHVMELPRHREIFEVKDYKPVQPVGINALRRAFDNAIETHATAADTAYRFLDEQLSDTLDRRFKVGWGNRLQRQMENYVPVVIDCGGSIGEATDHVLATKLLRKIRDRHDNRPEDIIALRDKIEKEWSHLDSDFMPRKSLALIRGELHRLGHEED